MGLILSIVIGILAGYLGSLIFKGSGLGLIWNLIVGLVGGVIGGAVFEFLGFHGQGIIWQLIAATVGAIILLWIVSLLRKK
ncbi:GlsB/YeaQ/YmgE family stress response membrane protein [Marinilabilia salmonicolor]|uniref:GlsB/YeaQ/YmgE family stress response membrane protein n=1 Tax=Marinilabilia salmonicolor TaxID=989 RepID=UPI00029B120C|nr:GlsB/YeaQ/YmgE family stress response membrane protein [Marinilabilia salmonicolor]